MNTHTHTHTHTHIYIYRERDNVVVDALSFQDEEKGHLFALYYPILDWLEEAYHKCFNHVSLYQLIQRLHKDPNPLRSYTW